MGKQSNLYDAVIVGGGPAGTSAAIHLAMRGARVLLAEQKKFPRAKLCGEFISPECFDHFEKLGVAAAMGEAKGAELTETVFYSRSGASVNVPSEWLGGNGHAALGLSRAEMDARLLKRARASGVEVLEEARAAGLLTEGERICGVRFNTGAAVTEVNALMTIDATGRARALARRVERARGVGPGRRTANLVAFKAHLENARGVAGHCEIYFYRGGYGGLSTVEGGLSNLCFIAQARDVRACGAEAEQVMREVLMKNARAAQTLSHARAASPWLAVALEGFGRGVVAPARGLLAIGDAASFIDPFTGSGMLMALESGELAAGSIARHLPSLGKVEALDAVNRDYRTSYNRVFNARLRRCALMRRAAFIPRLAETLIFMLGRSERARKGLSRSTRR
jgi:flavin-dependent dehydrogenase